MLEISAPTPRQLLVKLFSAVQLIPSHKVRIVVRRAPLRVGLSPTEMLMDSSHLVRCFPASE